MVDLCWVVEWSGIQMVVWKPDWKKSVMVQSVRYLNGPKSNEFTTWIPDTPTAQYSDESGIQMVTASILTMTFSTGTSRRMPSGRTSSAINCSRQRPSTNGSSFSRWVSCLTCLVKSFLKTSYSNKKPSCLSNDFKMWRKADVCVYTRARAGISYLILKNMETFKILTYLREDFRVLG